MVWARLVTTSTPPQPHIKENSVLMLGRHTLCMLGRTLSTCTCNVRLTYTEVLTVAITLNITNLVLYNTVGRVLNVWFNDCVLCWLKPNCESNNCVG